MSERVSHGRRRLRADEGFTLIEMVISLAVLTVGILGTALGFDTSRRLSLVSERHATMAHVAQREIEKLEGISYAQIGMSAAPSHSSDSTNPDYYVVNGSPPSLQLDRSSTSSTAALTIDTVNGAVPPVQAWSEGSLSGEIHDYVTWSNDPDCSTQCPSTGQDYKRLTVAVTVGGGLQPNPVYVTSVVSDPAAAPSGGVTNGSTGNPLKNPGTRCQSGTQVVACTSGLESGNPNIWFLHDWSSWSASSPQLPAADHPTHNTVNVRSGGTCSSSVTTGCPQPDLMDANPPPGDSSTPCYQYSSEQSGTVGCGRLLQPTSDSACVQGSTAFSALNNLNTEFWVTSPLSATTALTGNGGLSVGTQTAAGASAAVTLCIAIYDVPGSVTNMLSSSATYLGAAAFTPPTAPVTGANWPTAATSISFVFNFLASSSSVSVPAGHRIGARVWVATAGTAVALLYDNPLYPAQLQLNSQ